MYAQNDELVRALEVAAKEGDTPRAEASVYGRVIEGGPEASRKLPAPKDAESFGEG